MTYELFTILKLYQEKYPENFERISPQDLEQKLPQLKNDLFKKICHEKNSLTG